MTIDIADVSSPVLVIGSVTWDLVDGERIAGGTASYIARTCDAVGVRARFLVPAGEDASLDAVSPHEVHRVPAQTQTFRHSFRGDERQLDLEQGIGHMLRVSDVPADWPAPSTLLIAPLMPDDIEVTEFLDEWPAAEVGLLAQGLQRVQLPESTAVANRAQPSSVLLDAARPNVTIFLSREEVRTWPAGAVTHLAARAARVVVTDGARGAVVHDRRGTHRIDAAPATVVDSTGAGDTFAAAFILGLRAGEQYAGRLAAACAAAAVEVRGPALLPSRSAIEARLASAEASDGNTSA